MEDKNKKHYSHDAIYGRGSDQGFAAGLLIMGGIGACERGWVICGLIISLFGVLIYLDSKIEI